MRYGRFLGLCTMILASVLFVVQTYISFGPKSPGEVRRVGPPTAINEAPPEASERTNPTAIILSGILFVIGGGMYVSELRRVRPAWIKNEPEHRDNPAAHPHP